ncbi:MAG: VTT domain-containing protein [Bifidobacteriaceae bacterium]|jgi:membrane protein DedA with SNARE-associated domain|nr:VTT domain-containing protein [Bifidobacteriaceae bacterium]
MVPAPAWQTVAPWLADPSLAESVWHSINQFIIGLAESPWALLAAYLISAIDGFFPPVPAETLVVATAAVYSASGMWWQLLGLWALAAAGAVTGDLVAYSLGRWFNAGEWRVFRRGKGHDAFKWAQRIFARGAAPLLMVARFIPVGRVAVNLTAGTVRYPLRRFVVIDATAGCCWSAYSVGVGSIAGQAVGDNPLLGVLCGIVFAVSLGTLVQWLINRHYGKQPVAGSEATDPDGTEPGRRQDGGDGGDGQG